MTFMAGDFVGVKCQVKKGPFDNEQLVTVETIDGMISGFVKSTELRETAGQWEVRGRVESMSGSIITVMINGSFFTTNGIANISSDLAMAA